ncbi:MAG: hypothetical protein KA439_07090 [Rhizobacter sp.]|nr:hypothetical protein [Rhizobacter sp.]
MVILPSIFALLNQRKKRILQVAEAALPEGQFRAFRSLVLDELGREGFERDVERLVAERKQGMVGAGPHAQRKEVPHE